MHKYPPTPEKPVVNSLHGINLSDPYQWLEDKLDPEVQDWTRKQHDATVSALRSTPEYPGLHQEIEAYLDRDILGPIFLKADRQFFYKKQKGDQQYKLYTRLSDEDIIIFDPHPLDDEGKAAISGLEFTEDAGIVAVGVQLKGDEISNHYLIDTKTGNKLGDPVMGLRGFEFTKDGKSAYVAKASRESLEKQEPIKTYLHKIGSDPEKDVFLNAPKDAKNFVSFTDSRYSDLTFMFEGDFYSNTVSVKPIGSKKEFKTIYSSNKNRAYPSVIGDKIYLYTNDNAPNFKIMVADKANPEFENWKTLIPEKKTVIEDFELTETHLIVKEKKDVMSRLLLYTLDGKFVKEIAMPELGNVSSTSYHKESNTLFANIATFTAPAKMYKCDADTFEWELFFEQETPINTDNITASIKFYESKDGTRIPIFLVHRKDLDLNGDNPSILYGYGGFNIGISPGFIGLTAAFINRGGIWARAGIRGGDEYGEAWHNDGMLEKKQNCFDDFIAAAEFLIDENYTQPSRLSIKGGSNGGLLVGAVMTQRPDLFKAVVCAVPLLDMIRYHKFLIARYWIPEYGDPELADDFRTLLQYSPYHNIRVGTEYPATLIRAGENDTRVDPLHAKKFAARLQANKGQGNQVMLYMDYDSGHGSGKSTEQQIEDYELEMRWLMDQLGVPADQ